jgi:hypothetical protein
LAAALPAGPRCRARFEHWARTDATATATTVCAQYTYGADRLGVYCVR